MGSWPRSNISEHASYLCSCILTKRIFGYWIGLSWQPYHHRHPYAITSVGHSIRVHYFGSCCSTTVWVYLHLHPHAMLDHGCPVSENLSISSPKIKKSNFFSETSIMNCHNTLHNDPEERRSRLLHGRKLKSWAAVPLYQQQRLETSLRSPQRCWRAGNPTGGWLLYHLAKPQHSLLWITRPINCVSPLSLQTTLQPPPITTLLSHCACI
jgi:hypothetical protein